jgi:hypothetical protein
MNHIPNPIRCTLALPDDINPADIDWSPLNALEAAGAPRLKVIARNLAGAFRDQTIGHVISCQPTLGTF